MIQEVRRKMGQLRARCLFAVAIAVVTVMMVTFCEARITTASAGTLPKARIVSDLSTYSSSVEITWDAPAGFTPAEYVIYVDGCERYRTSTNGYTFTDMAPGATYVVTVRPVDGAGFLYEASAPLSIETTYTRKLLVSASAQAPTNQGADAVYSDIQTAVNAAKPGDVIVVKDGYYAGAISIGANRSGTAAQWITLKAESKAAWLFGNITCQASYYRIEGLKTYLLREITDASELRPNEVGYGILEHDGKKLVMFDSKAVRGGISISGSNTQVVYMEITNATGAGFSLAGKRHYFGSNIIRNTSTGGSVNGSDLIVDNNEICGIAKYATVLTHSDIDVMRVFGFNNIIRNNYVHHLYEENIGDSHTDFIQTYDNNREITRNLLIEGNYVDCYLAQGIWIESGSYPGEYLVSDITIRNNVIKGFTAWAMCGYKARNILAENNLFIGDGAIFGTMIRAEGGQATYRNNIYVDVKVPYGGLEGAVLTDTGNNLMYKLQRAFPSEKDWTADPLFVDEENGDYRLQVGSPAIDAGIMTSYMSPEKKDDTSPRGLDVSGELRISGSSIDIGPYEYQHNMGTNVIQTVLFNKASMELGVGDIVATDVTLYPVNATNTRLTYESSDESVARVNENGEVIGVGVGSVTLTARAHSGAYDTCEVVVKQLPGIRNLSFDPEVIAFQADIHEYNVEVEYDTTSITITPEWVNGQVTINGTKVTMSGASVPISLNVGDNAIVVTYTPNTGAAVSYRVNLKRSGICYYNAKEGFSDTQGKNQWYYYRNMNGELIELTWSEAKGMWTMHDSLYRPWIQSDRQHSQDGLGGSVRGFKSPMDGTVAISGDAIIGGRKPYTNGSILSIRKNDEVLWTEHIYEGHEQFSPYILVDVKAGDMIYFTEDFYGKQESHNILWNPTIALSMAEGYEVALPGDINVDGKVDEGDLATIATNLSKTSADTDWTALKSCDRNTDGKLDILDLVMVGKLVKKQ